MDWMKCSSEKVRHSYLIMQQGNRFQVEDCLSIKRHKKYYYGSVLLWLLIAIIWFI